MDFDTLREKIEQGDFDGVKDFIKNHPDSINKKDGNSGMTALMFAAEKGNKDILKLLLNNDADVNRRNTWDGFTALHFAVAWNHREAVEELLKKTTIQVNPQDFEGHTPLHWACFGGYKDIVGSLLSHNDISTNVVNRQGDTPLHLAVQSQNYDVVTLMLSQESLDLEIRNNKNWTPLLQAVSRGHLGIMQKVIARGAKVNVDNEGNNCLHLALTKQRKLFYSEVEHMDILDKCCKDLKLGKEERLSRVVVACYLAHHGANFYCKNKSGRTPLDLIEKGNVKETLMTLFLQRCVFCEDEDATQTFLPCKHLSLCKKCCPQKIPKRCPICGQNITSKTSLVGPNSSKMEVQMVAEPVEKRTFEDKEIQTLTEPIAETPALGKTISKVSEPTPSTSQPVESLNLGEEHLHRVAKKLGSKWQQVGRELGIKQVDLDIIKSDFPNDTVEQSFRMLHKWFQSCDPAKRTLERLREALNEIECFDALERLSLDVN